MVAAQIHTIAFRDLGSVAKSDQCGQLLDGDVLGLVHHVDRGTGGVGIGGQVAAGNGVGIRVGKQAARPAGMEVLHAVDDEDRSDRRGRIVGVEHVYWNSTDDPLAQLRS